MLKRLLASLLLLLTACGTPGRSDPKATSSATADLEARYSLYHSLAPRGWDSNSGCDALLFVSLLQAGLGEQGPVEQAQGSPGRWYRNDSLAASCSSDVSRDMFMGLFVWIWQFKRLDVAEEIWAYGQANNWKMGEERKDFDNRAVFTPVTIAALADLIHALGGEDHGERHIPRVYNVQPGFVSHLTLLQLYLRGETKGGLTEGEIDVLRAIRQHMSLNPLVHALLHRYTDGDQTAATSLLLSIWPSERLPTSTDWSEIWRPQRSDGDPGLQPGYGDEPHSGGDFLFVAALVLGKLDRP